MSALDQRAPASYRSLSGRPLGCAAGVALAAAIEFLVRHIAPEAPAVLGLGLAGLAGLAIVALAFTLEDQALPKLTQAVLAGVGLTVLGALADPEARLQAYQFRFRGVRRRARRHARAHGGEAAARVVGHGGAVRGRVGRLVRLCGGPGAGVARSDDRRLHDLSRDCDHGRPTCRRGQLAAAHVGCRGIDHAGLFLGAGASAGPHAGANRADLTRGLHVRAARSLRRARACSRWRFWRAISRGAPACALSPRPARNPRPSPERERGGARRRRRFRRVPGRNGGRGARHARRRRARACRMRAAARRASRPPARAAQGPRRARSRR